MMMLLIIEDIIDSIEMNWFGFELPICFVWLCLGTTNLSNKIMSRGHTMKEWAKNKFRVIFWNLKSSSLNAVRSNFRLLASFMPIFGLKNA